MAAFARDEGIGPTRRAVLVLDQAGWHTSPELVLPPGIDLAFLPAERRWSLVDEPVANRTFPNLDALEATLVERCCA
ncbi:MAG: IS630 family transposase, partial [Chloroflexota bacterium]|nr:IS630 family transposase [Chloroflexota bacterium]